MVSIEPGCPETANLSKLLEHDLSEDEIDRLMAHVDECEVCQDYLGQLAMRQDDPIGARGAEMPAGTCADPTTEESRKAEEGRRDLGNPFRQSCRSIGPYRIIRTIGCGGMGQVFECLDTRLDRRVAVKSIKPQGLNDQVLERLQREARIHARLSHPNIVPLLDFDVTDGMPYLVMELVEGPTLRDILRQNRVHVTHREAATLTLSVARALHTSHALGILHCDLKPANVLLSAAPNPVVPQTTIGLAGRIPKVADFGLARCFDVAAEDSCSMVVVGTPAYMAPEQIRGSARAIGPATDIYAMGVVLYEMLTGRVPFVGDDLSELATRIVERPPVPPGHLAMKVAADLETICLKCLEKDPRHRYATAADLADDLERFLAGRPIKARPIGMLGKSYRWARRNPHEAIALGVAAASILAVGIGGFVSARIQADLRREAESRKTEAEAQRRIADDRLVVLQQKYFDELEAAKRWFLILREMSGSDGTIAAEKIDRDRLQSLYVKIVEHRFQRASDLIHHPEFRNLHLEQIVEANYLSALQTLNFDRPLAYKQFQAAVDLAVDILAERPLNEIGRAAAINSDNFLGIFRSQVNDHAGALPHYRNAWDLHRLRPGESFRSNDLKRFSVQVGKNLVETYESLGRMEEATQIRSEVETLEGMLPDEPQAPAIAENRIQGNSR